MEYVSLCINIDILISYNCIKLEISCLLFFPLAFLLIVTDYIHILFGKGKEAPHNCYKQRKM